ncbi:outer membrane protein [Terriglobus sp. RCC_193]|uniref:outer membrane protein n=1 Tax=Terriglobus sp. RCC_193 TaxID=3239218 RepID=UPI003524B029
MQNKLLASIAIFLFSSALHGQATYTAERAARQQIAVSVGGSITRKITSNGLTYDPTSAGLAEGSYRFNFNHWLGVEADYDYFRNSQKFLTSTSTFRLKSDVHTLTGGAVINLPNPLTRRFNSFLYVGGGEMFFVQPNATSFESQMAPVIAFGGGIDVPMSRHLALRLQGKNYLYKAPAFGSGSPKLDKYAQTLVPTAGVVFNF